MEVGADETAIPTKLDIGFAWADQGRKLLVTNILKTAPTGFPATANVKATPACIIPAGQTRPLKIATSGWKSRSVTQLLDNEKWTGLVRQFSKIVGFKIPSSIRDTPMSREPFPENNGRYMACHAEKKLGLYFLNLQIRHTGISFEDALQGKLREVNLPLHRRRARIYLGHRPCKNCRDFLRLIRKRAGIDVRWTQSTLFTEHKRDETFKPSAPRLIDVAPTPDIEEAENVANIKDEDDANDNDTENEAEPLQKKQPNNTQDNYYENEEDVIESVEVDELEKMEDVIETLPVGNVTRPRQMQMPDRTARDNERDREAMPPPPAVRNATRMSVQSSPSPSLSMASVVESTMSRHQRYPTYSSPSRRDDSVAPPSVWGGRSKPPVTACLVPPDEFWGAYGNDMTGRVMTTSSPSQPANGTSYFFGTPSVASTPVVESQEEQNAQPHSQNRQNRTQNRLRNRLQDGAVQRTRAPTLTVGNSNPMRATSPPLQVYVPPYLRRLRQPLYTDTTTNSGNNGRSRTTGNARAARSSTPVIDLTEPADHGDNNDDVGFLHSSPSFDSVIPVSTTSSVGNNVGRVNNAWHPPMRRITTVQSAEPDLQISPVQQASRPVRHNPQQQRARRRGIAVPVRRRRRQARNTFPDLSSYHYTEPEDI